MMYHKKICIDCRMAHMSGIGTYIQHVIPRCMAALPEISFNIIGNSSLPFDLPSNSLFTRASSHIYSLYEQIELSYIVRETQGLWVPHYVIPLFSRIPIVATVHDVAHLALPEIFGITKKNYAKWMFSFLKKRTQSILFDSSFTKQEFNRLVGEPDCPTFVTPLGVDMFWFEETTEERPFNFPYFLAVGNLKPHKNIATLCRAFSGIASQCPHHLVLVGKKEGFRTGLDGTALENLVPGRIHCTGALDAPSLRRLVTNADCLVFPSLYEGFGLPPLEGLACGTPVLASDIPPVRETCADAVNYFNPHSESSLREGLLRCAAPSTDPAEREARRRRAALFSWDKTATLTVSVLKQAFRL